MSIGRKIIRERKKRGLSQEKLARILHLNRVTLGRYERDEVQMDVNTLINMCRYFEISVDAFLK